MSSGLESLDMASTPPDVDLTVWLRQMSAGDSEAAERVASAVYKELRRLAASAIGPDGRFQSLQPTVLVHEAFLQLIKSRPIAWQDRGHFYSLAARMMRRIVIDHFRCRNAQKRPPRNLQVSVEDALIFDENRSDEALIVDEALVKLTEIDARAAKVVELRYFGGFTVGETARVLGVADRTVKRDWEMAQWWLKQFLTSNSAPAKAEGA